MDKKEQLEEQDAPHKNTDNAFVRVGEDGKPELPEDDNTNDAAGNKSSNNPKEGSLADR
ncbi:MAG TPA: hypothetical protein VM888_02060 [Chitinophagaceae bacterium]|nr:hypothetical protein [Chitinophagaceae bacterium]